MVVRFLPEPAAENQPPPRDRGDLAEVIDLRSRLPQLQEESRREAQRPVSEPRRIVQPDRPTGFGRAAGFERAAETDGTSECDAGFEGAAACDEAAGLDRAVERSRSAEEDAVRLLARRARSSGELRRELASLGHDASDVEAVVLDCESSLYLDDLGLARVLSEGLRARKRASRAQIRVKLRERLLPDGIIEEVLGELDDDEENELLRQAAGERARKMSGLDRQTAERRLLGFLARRGWSGERAVRVAREALDSTAARGAVRFR